jgi:glycine cleavage system H protein
LITMVAIFVVVLVLAALTVDSVLRRLAPSAIAAIRREIPLPGGLFLDTGHTWAALEQSGRVRVGLDDLVRAAIGKADRVEFPQPGTEVKRGDPLFALVCGGRRAVLEAPMDGVVGSVNPELAESAAALAHDPYRKGWICALSPKNLGTALSHLKVAEEAKEWLAGERQRFDDFAASQTWRSMVPGTAMADGGKPADGILEFLDEEAWAAFGHDFLATGRSESAS